MASSRHTALGKNKAYLTICSAAMASCLVAVTPAAAQTVIIGGGNERPVIVTYPPVSAPVYPSAQGVLQPANPAAPTTGVDYSKGARIVTGDEVIVLTPPSEQKKKKVVVSKPAKPKPAPVQKAEVSKPAPVKPEPVKEPVKQAEVTPKAEPVKEAPAKQEAAPTAPAPVAKVEAPKEAAPAKPATPEISKDVAKAAPEKVEPPKAEPPKEMAKPAEKMAESKEAAPAPAPVKEMTAVKPAETGPKQIAPVVPKVEEAKSEETKVAALDPKSDVSAATDKIPEIKPDADKNTRTVMFDPEETGLPSNAEPTLKAISNDMKAGQDRVQIVAYASASNNGRARRISLGRALTIRTKLMEMGVPNNRIEVRALGLPEDNSPADRVELKIISR